MFFFSGSEKKKNLGFLPHEREGAEIFFLSKESRVGGGGMIYGYKIGVVREEERKECAPPRFGGGVWIKGGFFFNVNGFGTA